MQHCTVTYSELSGGLHLFKVKTGVSHVHTVHVIATLTVEKGSATATVTDPAGVEHTVTVAPGAPTRFEEDVRVDAVGFRCFIIGFKPLGGGDDAGVAAVKGLVASLGYSAK